jgi:membrane-bound lytic murein transglycosylase B
LLLLLGSVAAAQTPSENTDPVLQAELDRLNAEIEQKRDALRGLREKREGIQDDIAALQLEIQRTELSIQRSNLAIAELQREATVVADGIAVLEANVAEHHATLGHLIREVDLNDADSPLAVFFASGSTLTDIASQLEASRSLQGQLLGAVTGIRDAQAELEAQRDALLVRQQEEEQARTLLEVEQEDLLVKQGLESRLLASAATNARNVEQQLRRVELDAAKIRRQLFPLTGGGAALTFEEAYILADPIAKAVGIRTAFLLAIIQKETRFGANVGTGLWRVDMHPRDWDAFIQITSELGLNPDDVPVSRKPSYGWGGAMGPAQFIPTTWLAYKDRVAAVTGHNPPSPWNMEDAFTASAIKLAAGGATTQNRSAEWKAAMIYFAGGNWSNPAYAFYGDSVEDLASEFQAYIDVLESGA